MALITAIADHLAQHWHPDITQPRIYALAVADRMAVDGVGRALARLASQQGAYAPLYNLADGSPGLEPTCKHRFGVTDLPLDDAVAANGILFAISPWTRVAPRSKRLLMRISPQLELDIVTNAEAANPVLTIQIGQFAGAWLAVISDDLIAAEVVGRAIRAVAQPDDWDGINPWQHPLVQIGTERNLGVRSPEAVLCSVDLNQSLGKEPIEGLLNAALDLASIKTELGVRA